MTDLEKMAREAGFGPCTGNGYDDTRAPGLDAYVRDEYNVGEELERFAQAVAKRCTEICVGLAESKGWVVATGDDCAAAIAREFGLKETPDA